MNDEFHNFWQTAFPNCPPISYLFKRELSNLWFRAHSLPESKRYAENESEMSEILRRQKVLIEDMIGTIDDCFLVCSFSNYYTKKFSSLSEFFNFDSQPIPRKVFEPDDDDYFDEPCYISFGKRKIVFDEIKEMFVLVANDELRFFIFNPNTKRIFAPYDGGVDLILETSAIRDKFKSKYKDWLSSHSDGY
jgi:hypothetical protein